MSIVPRYEFIVSDTPPLGQVVPVDNGELCKYADHVVAVAAAREDERGKALDAARDAVKTSHSGTRNPSPYEVKKAALAAIDALREPRDAPHDDPCDCDDCRRAVRP